MVWRDGLLTLLLWVALVWLFVRQSVVLGRRIDEILLSADPASPAAWEYPLLPYLTVALILVVRLSAWGLVERRHHGRVTREPAPAPLELSAEARRIGVGAEELSDWRRRRVSIMHIDEKDAYRVESKDALRSH
jgi:poly-beta-1,6-N-acetyl-D-glucosamine biosynthesis protein PgaD